MERSTPSPENLSELRIINRAVSLIAAILVFSGLPAGSSTREQPATSRVVSSTSPTTMTPPATEASTTTVSTTTTV